MTSTEPSKEEILTRLVNLEQEVKELREENEELREGHEELRKENEALRKENEKLRAENKRLRAKLRWYEGPHTLPSKDQSTGGESSSSLDEDDDGEPRTDGGTPGWKPGHDPEWRVAPDPDREIEVTCECCPECGEAPDSSRRSPIHSLLKQPSSTATATSATAVAQRQSPLTPNCPSSGQFGVNVIAQAALSRYDHRLPYRKIADRFEQLHELELSGASAWHATERAARAGRCEYERIRQQIQGADVVHVDETGVKRDGEQAWIWTFRTEKHTLYAVRESRGHDVPAEVLGEDFAGTIVCDGWTAYPAFSEKLQRCWAHILREAEDVASDYDAAKPVYRSLKRMYVGLQAWLETDPALRERAEMHRSAQASLNSLIERSVNDGPVATLLGKIKGGLDHWLTFVGEPAVSPTNNAAENALREPVVLRKIIGTLRNDRGMFVHETILSLLATWRQQGRNPYEEFKRVVRDNEMISRAQAKPVVESSG